MGKEIGEKDNSLTLINGFAMGGVGWGSGGNVGGFLVSNCKGFWGRVGDLS